MNYIPLKTGERVLEYDCAVCDSKHNTVQRIHTKGEVEQNYYTGLCSEHMKPILKEIMKLEAEWQRQEKEWQRRTVSLDKVRYRDAEGNPVRLIDTITTRPAHKTFDGPNDTVKAIVRRLYCKFGWGERKIAEVVQKDYGLDVAQRTIGYYLQELRNEGVKPGGYIRNPKWLEDRTVSKYIRWTKPDYTTKLEQQAKTQEQGQMKPFTLIPENTKPPRDNNAYTKALREGRDYLLTNIKYATVTNQM